MARPKKYPNTIQVTREIEKDGTSWLMIKENRDFQEDGEVAVYKLISVGTVTVARNYKEKKKVK